MTVLEGHIDHLGRPVLTIETAGPEPESFLCVLDTGFNRTLLILRPLAFGLGFKPYTPQIVGPISLADHKDHAAEVMSGRINWLGEALQVDIYTTSWSRRAGSNVPEILLGTELLRGLHVFLDFELGRVTIRRPGMDSPQPA